jgi:hypothetical protein
MYDVFTNRKTYHRNKIPSNEGPLLTVVVEEEENRQGKG